MSDEELRLARVLRAIANCGATSPWDLRVMARDGLHGVVFPPCGPMGVPVPADGRVPLIRSWAARVVADQPMRRGDVFRGWMIVMDDPRTELAWYLTHEEEWVTHVDPYTKDTHTANTGRTLSWLTK